MSLLITAANSQGLHGPIMEKPSSPKPGSLIHEVNITLHLLRLSLIILLICRLKIAD